MKKLILVAAFAALAACGGQKTEAPADNANAMDMNAEEANAMDANAMATPAAFEIKGTSWEFTRDGKMENETIDADGNYVAWSGDKHVDHGTAVMKDGKACFTSAMDKEGEVCWTTAPTEVGQSFDTTSDKGEKLTVKRIAFLEVPEAVKP